VAIINRTMAERYWPGTSAIGKTIRLNTQSSPPVEIVGVVGPGKYRDLGERPLPYLFLPLSQNYTGNVTLVVRSAGDPLAELPAVRKAIEAADPEMPIFDPKSMDQLIDGRTLLGPRVAAGFAGVFGLLALGLAMVGLYGVISYSVVQRTREMGIRIALGAPLPSVRRMVLSDGLRLAGIGAMIGTAGGLGLSIALRSLFFGVDPTDPKLLLIVPLTLVAVALIASYLPALRATRVDPLRALRSE
jgi:putative ABC transport system permease protein